MADELEVMEIKEMLKKLDEGQQRIEGKLDKILTAAQGGGDAIVNARGLDD